MWSCDLDNDQNDEILLTNRDQLIAIRPQRPDEPVWQRRVYHLWTDEIEGILPANPHHGQQVILRHVAAPASIYAVDASTGMRLWTTPAPSPRRQGDTVFIEPSQVAMLSGATDSRLPRLFFQHGIVSCVREAAAAAEAVGPVATGGRTVRTARFPARFSAETNDPRRLRPLPWVPIDHDLARCLTTVAWAIFLSVTLVYIPAIFLIRSLHRRQWSLKWFFLLPVVAAAPLTAILTNISDLPAHGVELKLILALITLPVPVAIAQLIAWSKQQKWQRVSIWLAATLGASVILAVISLIVTQSNDRSALQEGERYAWDGWWLIWLHGAYLTACLLIVSHLFAIAKRAFVHRKRRTQLAQQAI